jgi:hypothetical protein
VTSNISSLAVPTDIPWRRICVSGDMLDPEPCDLVVPPRWRSSIVVFRHDPPDEFQPLPHSRVSYLKVCVTLAPFAPELEVKLGKHAADMLEEAFPCHGALLHVTVSPPEDARGGDRRDYPYFADFEPKKRELYEMVSETGEVLSGSSATLAVGKSAASTQTTENYNIDNGWNFGANFTYGGIGGGAQAGVQKTDGTVQSSGYHTSNVHMRDESTERRELMSHTTQLAQMYNLFQAFHVGTNRALFLMEPRPHIRQSEATFINGPRALEGIQEVFLVVVRPRDMSGFCVGALLETAHLGKEPVLEHETTTRVLEFRLEAKAPNLDNSIGKDSGEGKKSHIVHFDAPKGWEISGYQTAVLRGERIIKGPTVIHDGQHLTVTGEVSWRFEEGKIKGGEREDIYHDGALDVDVLIKLRRKEAEVKEYVRTLFLSGRQICCCPKAVDLGKLSTASVTYERPLDWHAPVHRGPASPSRVQESRRLAATIRDEMVRSTSSSARVPVGARRYEETDAFASRFASILAPVEAPMISRDASGAPEVSATGDVVEAVDALTLLHTPVVTTARRMGVTEAQARQLRLRAIEALAADREG